MNMDITTPPSLPATPSLEGSKKAIQLTDYSEKSFLVSGKGTYDLRQDLKGMGGSWNSTLKGWIFPLSRRSIVQKLVDEYVVIHQSPPPTKGPTPRLTTPTTVLRNPLIAPSSSLTPTPAPTPVVESRQESFATGKSEEGIAWERTERTEVVIENGKKIEIKTIIQIQKRTID